MQTFSTFVANLSKVCRWGRFDIVQWGYSFAQHTYFTVPGATAKDYLVSSWVRVWILAESFIIWPCAGSLWCVIGSKHTCCLQPCQCVMNPYLHLVALVPVICINEQLCCLTPIISYHDHTNVLTYTKYDYRFETHLLFTAIPMYNELI